MESRQVFTPPRLSQSSTGSESDSVTRKPANWRLRKELDGCVLVGVNDFAEKWILPSAGTMWRGIFDEIVDNVLQGTEGDVEWAMPGTFSQGQYVSWVGGRIQDVCSRAEKDLGHRIMMDLKYRFGYSPGATSEDLDLVADWAERLQCRAWATNRGDKGEDTVKEGIHIALSASPGEPERWDKLLILGEHKSDDSESCRREATVQLASHAGEVLGSQPFRHYVPGFSLVKDQMQLWIFDRMGCFASPLFNVSTNQRESRRTFIELVLALTVMDSASLGFDPLVYKDTTCETMWEPTAYSLPGNQVDAYIRISEQVFELHQILFIHPGLMGRGTRCFLAAPVPSDPYANEDSANQNYCIVKMSWRDDKICHEGVMLDQVGKNLNVRNVVRVHAFDQPLDVKSWIRKGVSTGQPFPLLDTPSTRPHGPINRTFTRTVLRDAGRPLSEAASALELLQAIRDAFIGHGTLYFYELLLHCDISRSNILLSHNGLSAGFLIDLDYAVQFDPISLLTRSSEAAQGMGTLPYMALDILGGSDVHIYHHDVESFLYVLIWSCIYDSQGRGYVPQPNNPELYYRTQAIRGLLDDNTSSAAIEMMSDPLRRWRKGRAWAIGAAKETDLESNFELLLQLLRPGFNNDPVRELLQAMKGVLFGNDQKCLVTPCQRLAQGWSTEERRKDEWGLYAEVQVLMDEAIRKLS
ncbi:MAG: hypothetical protein M1840_000446 [Geoglossum simile]|nr:MAG: hypothetical protein M1840_000446 [Geoglossum simile]